MEQKWCYLSDVHTAYCQKTIEEIVVRLNETRKIDEQDILQVSFDIGSGRVKVFSSNRLAAEVYMDGDSGFPSCVVVNNSSLSDREVQEFRCVRDSRDDFKNWLFEFSVKQISS